MKYFFDTEFHEYNVRGLNTIELISIGMVDENDREYYAICNEFDIEAAWNNQWLRENVLEKIYNTIGTRIRGLFSLNSLKRYIKINGKSREEIAQEIIDFTTDNYYIDFLSFPNIFLPGSSSFKKKGNPEFYVYYADYDWVVFCWLFGRMIDLPNGFPMYCRDLKQMLDEKLESTHINDMNFLDSKLTASSDLSLNEKLRIIKSCSLYPKQNDEHNALDDAKWNKKLFQFINETLNV